MTGNAAEAIADSTETTETPVVRKIAQNITGFTVKKVVEQPAPAVEEAPQKQKEVMHEQVKRPDTLIGETYKINPPTSDHAFYLTINDIVLNEGTEDEHRQPYEIFVNTKNMQDYQWITAVTLLISAVFRKGGDVTFIAEELQGVFDPKGGYFKKGGKFMNSLVAEIGATIGEHMKMIGLIESPELSAEQKVMIDQKLAQYKAKNGGDKVEGEIPGAIECPSCKEKAAILMDGCLTCTSCGHGKCQ